MTTTIGLDWSVTSPGVCINEGKTVYFYFFAQRRKHKDFDKTVLVNGISYTFRSLDYPEFEVRESRYDDLANIVMVVLRKHKTQPIHKVYLEGYAFAAQGRGVSILYEAGAIIRNKLFKENYDVEEVAPTSLKKTATGKGNSNKIVMSKSFQADTGLDMFEVLGLNNTTMIIPHPIEDLTDAFFLTVHADRMVTMKTKQIKSQKKKITDPLIRRLLEKVGTNKEPPSDTTNRSIVDQNT